MNRSVVLVGAGGLAREVMSMLENSLVQRVVAILDDDPAQHGQLIGGVAVTGGTETALSSSDVDVVVTIGSGRGRANVVRRLLDRGLAPDRFGTVIDPSVVIPSTCYVGCGSVLLSSVVLTSDVRVGQHVVAMPHVVLTHDVVVDDFATLCAGVALGGGVQVGRGAYLGMNASVRERVHIGESAVLGAGAVLLHDLPGNEVWAGVPARMIRAEAMATPTEPSPADDFVMTFPGGK